MDYSKTFLLLHVSNPRYGTHHEAYRLNKPVSHWLETLPHRITGLNIQEYLILDINKMERNDLWSNVKDNYIFFIGKILLNLDRNN